MCVAVNRKLAYFRVLWSDPFVRFGSSGRIQALVGAEWRWSCFDVENGEREPGEAGAEIRLLVNSWPRERYVNQIYGERQLRCTATQLFQKIDLIHHFTG